MAAVLPDKWAWFTKIKPAEAVEMWTRDDLLVDEDASGFDKWMELVGPNGYGEGYAVALRCECGGYQAYEVTFGVAYHGDYDDADSTMMQLDGLDALMRPFVDDHRPHRWQMRLEEV